MQTEIIDQTILMDRIYRRQRFIYDLTRKYYLFGRDRLIHDLRLQEGERLVEVGCGTARNLLQVARRYPKAQLYGLDISGEMLRSAQETTRRTGLQVKLVQAGAEDLRPELFGQTENFDRIVFS